MKGELKSRHTAPCMAPCVKCGASDISRRYRREGEKWEEWERLHFEPCRETEHVVYRDYRCIAKRECLTHCCKVCGYSWTTDIHKAASITPASGKG